MKDRIRLIRHNAGLTQEQFGKKIGVTRNAIATYETNVRIPIDVVVHSICQEFDVNETWLRTGEGPIYREIHPDAALSKWFGTLLREDPSSFKKQFMSTLAELNDKEWKSLETITEHLFAKKSC